MTAQERAILWRAQTLVKKGWTQNVYARDSEGLICDYRYRSATHFCTLGSIYRAYVDIDKEIDPSIDPSFDRQIPPLLGFVSADALVEWNDAEGRTQADVLARLQTALDQEEDTHATH